MSQSINRKPNEPRPNPRSGNWLSFSIGITGACLTIFSLLHFRIETNAKNFGTETGHQNHNDSLTIELSIKPPLPFKKTKFVEANPEVPENPPDETFNFSFRDQQAAQPKDLVKPKQNKAPQTEGKERTAKIVKSEKILKEETEQSSNSFRSLPIKKSSIKTPPQKTTKLDSNNGGISQDKPPKMKNAGLNLGRKDEKSKNSKLILLSDQKRKSETDFKQDNYNLSNLPQRQRPKISPKLINGPIMRSVSTAPRIGTLAIESRMHPYGVYVQEMLRAIEEQWNYLARGSMKFIQRDRLPSRITYAFTLHEDGKISNLQKIGGNTEELPAELCRQAIASRVPFGEWSKKMKQDFGTSDFVKISFSYR